jgi:threonylcarbamoyladenosine tRNA methylthiotransferase MtaB
LKRVAFCTFGCKLNQYDTETMRTLLEEEGDWRTVAFREEADVYIVNTCSVTARADSRARSAIRRIHRERPHARILATGCYAQRAPKELGELDGVSLVLGAADRERVAEELGHTVPGQVRLAVSPISEARTFVDVPITEMMGHSRAFVKVQEGCNESCSFCIIPSTRGTSRSRRPESVWTQVEDLVANGYTEIVITGVHVGDFGLDLPDAERGLESLMRGVLAVPGLERLRLSSIQPTTLSDGILDLVAEDERFCRHLHVPMQSGSEEVLRRMGRSYRIGTFVERIEALSSRIPDCGLGTDVICGFPGETEADFRKTFDLLEALPFTYLHAFPYSVRPGSHAEPLGDDVPADEKKRRTRALKRLSARKSREFRQRHLGSTMPVLIEEGSRNGSPLLSGLTDNYIRVDLGPGEKRASVEPVRLESLTDDGVLGRRLERE